MTSTTQNQINRLKNEIARLRSNDASEAVKEANLVAKINHANEAASRTKSTSTRQSKLKEAARTQMNLNKVQIKRANISKKISVKENQFALNQNRRLKEISRETN